MFSGVPAASVRSQAVPSVVKKTPIDVACAPVATRRRPNPSMSLRMTPPDLGCSRWDGTLPAVREADGVAVEGDKKRLRLPYPRRKRGEGICGRGPATLILRPDSTAPAAA